MARTRGITRNAGDPVDGKDSLPWLQTADDAFDEQPVLDRKWLFLGGAVFLAALIGTVWFFYTQADPNRQTGPVGEPPLILADKTPFKKRPEGSTPTLAEDEVDKVATGTAEPSAPNVAPEAAPPEALMDPATIFGTASREAAAASKAPDLPPPDTRDIAPPPQAKGAASALSAPEVKASRGTPAPVQQSAQAVVKSKPAAAKLTAQKPMQEKPTQEKPASEKPAPEKPAPETITTPSSKPAKAGVLLQVGAFSSVERANQGWSEISAKFAGLRGLSPDIVPVKVGSNTMYRLRAAGVSASARGAQICTELKAAGQPCLIVTP